MTTGQQSLPNDGLPAGLVRVLVVVFLLFTFLLGVKGLGDGFKLLSRDLLDSFFSATQNPLVGLIIGLLATTLVQSSSVSTSMIVALVAAPENPLPLANAVPMIMGANIGTTVTNTIVSLGHMGRRDEFRRAFSVATCHDFFNYISVIILLPMEMATGFLQRTAGMLSAAMEDMGGFKYESPLKGALKACLGPIKGLSETLFDRQGGQAAFLIVFSALVIFGTLFLLVKVMRSAVETRVERFINRFLGSSALLSFTVGAIVTVMVQSSSITTSLLVPLAGAGLLTLEAAFPVTIGANLGTTVTALLASLAVSGPNAAAGVQIAIVHLLFNICGTTLIYPFEPVRRIPLRMARWLADSAIKSRKMALLYVFCLFYVVPALLILLEKLL